MFQSQKRLDIVFLFGTDGVTTKVFIFVFVCFLLDMNVLETLWTLVCKEDRQSSFVLFFCRDFIFACFGFDSYRSIFLFMEGKCSVTKKHYLRKWRNWMSCLLFRESSVSSFYECQTFGGTVSFLSFPLIVWRYSQISRDSGVTYCTNKPLMKSVCCVQTSLGAKNWSGASTIC